MAPTPAVSPGSLSGMAVGGVAGAGILGGIGAGLRAAGVAGASGGLRSGGVARRHRTHGRLGARHPGQRGRPRRDGGRRGLGRHRTRRVPRDPRAGAVPAARAPAGGGRGKDKDKKKRKPATVELFDEDRDWIDDEGASSGVID